MKKKLSRTHRTSLHRLFELKCPECGHYHELTWGENGVPGGVKWETSEETKPNGRWDFQKLEKTIRYQCYNPSCAHLWEPTVRNRKEMHRNGRWTANDPTGITGDLDVCEITDAERAAGLRINDLIQAK